MQRILLLAAALILLPACDAPILSTTPGAGETTTTNIGDLEPRDGTTGDGCAFEPIPVPSLEGCACEPQKPTCGLGTECVPTLRSAPEPEFACLRPYKPADCLVMYGVPGNGYVSPSVFPFGVKDGLAFCPVCQKCEEIKQPETAISCSQN